VSRNRTQQRYAPGTQVWIPTPGVKGVVTQVDDTPSTAGEYLHTIRTPHGDRREFGINLDLIPEPIGQAPKRARVTQHIHMHGPNARVNTNSTDNSVNVATVSNDQVFVKIRDAAGAIKNKSERAEILAKLGQLQEVRGSAGFLNAYQQFISSVADYMTIFGPFIPALTAMLSGR
jgi:hypothetical protein